MIPIEKTNSINWEAIRAEYIGGGISQRKLADKHGVNADILMQRANREHWKQDRDKVFSKAMAKTQQKAADAISDNVTIAARIRTKLLRRLENEVDRLPEQIGSETINSIVEYGKNKQGNRQRKEVSHGYKLKDLAAAYKDLTSDLVQTEEAGNELLQSLLELERRAES